jgi:hypothetical protein
MPVSFFLGVLPWRGPEMIILSAACAFVPNPSCLLRRAPERLGRPRAGPAQGGPSRPAQGGPEPAVEGTGSTVAEGAAVGELSGLGEAVGEAELFGLLVRVGVGLLVGDDLAGAGSVAVGEGTVVVVVVVTVFAGGGLTTT